MNTPPLNYRLEGIGRVEGGTKESSRLFSTGNEISGYISLGNNGPVLIESDLRFFRVEDNRLVLFLKKKREKEILN